MRIGSLALFAKLGIKVIPVFIKLLKGTKSLKVILAFGSFGLWDLFFSWQFVVLLMLTIFIHESGHVWAMRRMGMKTKGFYFVPLLGGAAVPDGMFPSRGAESYIAIMGPIWGGLFAIPTLAAWYVTSNPLWAGITGWIAMLNLFNLLPVLPLDGGRILRSIAFSFSRNMGFILVGMGMLLGVFLSFKIGLVLFAYLFTIGGLEILLEARQSKKVRKIDAKLALLEKIFPTAKRDDIILALNQHNAKDRVVKLFTTLLWIEMDRIRKALIEYIPSDENEFDTPNAWERAHNYAVMNKVELINHQHHITAHILDWLYQEYDEDTYKLFQNPMSGWKILSSVVAYCTVIGSLYYAMYLTQGVPGSQAAFMIFIN